MKGIVVKVIIFIILFGITGVIHKTLDSSTWLAESKVAAKQVEPSDEVVVGMEAIKETRTTMNYVFGGVYVLLAIGLIGSISKTMKKMSEEIVEEVDNKKKEKKNEEN